MTAHALLSASGAHRWLNCTAAPLFESEFPDRASDYAEEGTLAHAIAELKLHKYIEPMSKATYTRRLNKLKGTRYTIGAHAGEVISQPEMDGYTDDYRDYVRELLLRYPVRPHIGIERRVEFSEYVPGGFGTADCLIVTPRELHVVDLKYGKGVPVSAQDNPQMQLYALGALSAYGALFPIERIHMTIFQPRINNVSAVEIGAAELRTGAEEEVKPKAREAAEGSGTFAPGAWCRFCRAKLECKARANYYVDNYLTVAHAKRDPRCMSHAELAQYLGAADVLKQWAEDMQDYALSECLAGAEVPGWKAVEGRGSRAFTDQDAAFAELIKHGIDETILYSRVPLTLAQTEKAIGKKEFSALVGKFVVKNPGKPALAPASDKRPAITNKTKAADVFEKIGG